MTLRVRRHSARHSFASGDLLAGASPARPRARADRGGRGSDRSRAPRPRPVVPPPAPRRALRRARRRRPDPRRAKRRRPRGGPRARRGRVPVRARRPSQPSSARSGSDHERSSIGRATRRKARSLRVATRSDGGPRDPTRDACPGRGASIARACAASAMTERLEPAGAPRRGAGIGGRRRRGSSARKSFGCELPRRLRLRSEAPSRAGAAPARHRRRARPRARGSAATTRRPSNTDTKSSTISAPAARTVSRRVRSRATGPTSRPRRNATRSASISRGGRAGTPVCSSSTRAAPCGSFSCQRPCPVLDAVAERHAVPREHEVGRVVVRRVEHAPSAAPRRPAPEGRSRPPARASAPARSSPSRTGA